MGKVEEVARAIRGVQARPHTDADVARAAIEAMRTIDDSMMQAALAGKWPALYRNGLYLPDDGPSLVKETEVRCADYTRQHNAMIDAALGEGE